MTESVSLMWQSYNLKMEGISFLVSCATFWGFRNIIGNEWERNDEV